MATADKWTMSSEQAQNYIVNPLTAPDPSDETGLNANFRSTFAPRVSSDESSKTQLIDSPSNIVHSPNKRHSRGPSSPTNLTGTRSRGNSLGQRFAGDMTHRPLDMLKKDSKAASRSHHLRKTSIPGVDTIDSLDSTPGGQYHHEGPYDATLLSRNINSMTSPVAAVAESNHRALEATPAENIKDAIERHRPLDGIASIPPGESDRYGRTFEYEETNLMTEDGGDFKKLPGEKYNDDQKNELETNRAYELGSPSRGEATAVELKEHPEHSRGKKSVEIREGEYNAEEHSSKRHPLEGLKKRIGSLRRKND